MMRGEFATKHCHSLHFLLFCGQSTITVLDRWTGLVDWTDGLIEIFTNLFPCMNSK